MPRQNSKRQAKSKLDNLHKTLKKLYKNAQQNNASIEQVLEAIEAEKRNQSIEFLKSATAEELSLENITREEISEFDSYSLDRYILTIEQKRRSIMRKYARIHAKINPKIRAAYKIKTMSEFTKEEMEGFIAVVREYDKNFDGLDAFEDEIEDLFDDGFIHDDDYDDDMF
jgi:predicted transcriptional regulator